MGFSPFRLPKLARIVPYRGFFAAFNKLSPQASAEVKALLRKIQEGPYGKDLVESYQSDFDLDTFTCHSSHGFSLEWHIEAEEFIEDDGPVPGLTVFLTELRIAGDQGRRDG